MKGLFLNYLYNLPNSTTGLDSIGVQTVTAVPALVPLLLLFVFFVVFLGGIARQKARSGIADYSMWSVVASLSMFMMALIMTLINGIIRLDWLVIVVVVTIASGVWFFFDRRESPV